MPIPPTHHEGHITRFGPFAFDSHTEELWKDGLKLKLQGQPLKVLAILLEKPGELVTREEIRQRLWPADTFVDFEHSLNTDIKRLREVLGEEAETPRYIETLRGKGYRFVGKAECPTIPACLSLANGMSPILSSAQERQGWSLRFTRALLAIAILITALIAAPSFFEPKPLKIAGSRRLTRTPYKKAHRVLVSIVTDGPRVYFREYRNGRWGISQVSTMGGDVSTFPVDYTEFPEAQDISPDLSHLLIADWYGAPCCRLWLAPLPSGPPRLIPNLISPWNQLTRDGKGVFYVNGGKELHKADLQGTNSRHLFTAPNITCPQQSPDGDRFRFTIFPDLQSTPTLWETRRDGTHSRQLFSDPQPTLCGIWSPDGRVYAFHRWDGSRWNLWAVRESKTWFGRRREEPVQLTFGPFSYLPSTFSRDGKAIYSLGLDARGELAAYRSNSTESSLFLPGTSATNVAFSRDGKWVAYVTYPEGILWRSRIDGSERRQLSFPPMLAMLPRWSPDGKLIVFSEVPNVGGIFNPGGSIYVVPVDNGGPMPLVAGRVNDPTWSADGLSIAFSETNEYPESPGVKIVDLKTRMVHTLPGSDRFYSPRWSPDGKYLVAVGLDALSVWLYTFADRRWVNLMSSNYPVGIGFPEWSYDSRYVYVNIGDEKIVRVDILRHHTEVFLRIKDIARTGWWGNWFGVTPDNKILLLRNIGGEDLYALDLQNP